MKKLIKSDFFSQFNVLFISLSLGFIYYEYSTVLYFIHAFIQKDFAVNLCLFINFLYLLEFLNVFISLLWTTTACLRMAKT